MKNMLRRHRQLILFSASSFLCFLVDYCLFNGLYALTSWVLISNVLARVISATINYTLNSRLVFQGAVRRQKQPLQYASLSIAILIGNSLLLAALTTLGLHASLAKLVTEAVLFVASYCIQRVFIFTKEIP